MGLNPGQEEARPFQLRPRNRTEAVEVRSPDLSSSGWLASEQELQSPDKGWILGVMTRFIFDIQSRT